MAATASPPVSTVRGPGLRREIGFIGLLWASGGSIIRSGRLFGAKGALATTRPAAVISWATGGLAWALRVASPAERIEETIRRAAPAARVPLRDAA